MTVNSVVVNAGYLRSKLFEKEECPICLGPFSINPIFIHFPPVGEKFHVFHLECMGRWEKEKRQCPTCRSPIRENDLPTFIACNGLAIQCLRKRHRTFDLCLAASYQNLKALPHVPKNLLDGVIVNLVKKISPS